MRQFPSHDPMVSVDIGANVADDPDEFGRLLGPVMAGARARGVADAFELMGVAAVLIDGEGKVLHAGGRAERALLPLVEIMGGHLVGIDAPINEHLQHLVESAIRTDAGAPACEAVKLRDGQGRLRLTMRAMSFPQDGLPGVQLLRAVLVVTEHAI